MIKNLILEIIFFSCLVSYSQLKFDTYLSDGRVTEGMSSYSFEFKFENEGESKVKITGLKSSCGCTVAKPDKEEYLPKEKGIIKGTFTIGDRVGIQEKQITVLTDSLSQSKIDLTVRVTIPKLITIKPSLIFWRQGDEVKPKEIQVDVDPSLEVKSLECDNDKFEIRLSIDSTKENQYKISATPKSTEEASRGLIKLKILNKKTNTEKIYYIHALIK